MSEALIPITSPSRKFIVAGAGRGASAHFSRLGDQVIDADFVIVDPDGAKASALSTILEGQGRSSRAVVSRIEDYLTLEVDWDGIIALMVDRPGSIAKSLRIAESQVRALLGYILIALPRGEFYGLRLAMSREDAEAKRDAALLFDAFSSVTERTGARAVVGAEGRLRHEKLEPLFRHLFEEHLRLNARKLLAGEEPEAHPIELSDGLRSRPVSVFDSRAGWASLAELATSAISTFRSPLARGSRFAIAEIGSDGVRIHPARLRADGAVTLRSYLLDRPESTGNDSALQRRVEAFDANVRALERATERDTLQVTRPVRMTD